MAWTSSYRRRSSWCTAGVPVCVTPLELIDKALAIASQPVYLYLVCDIYACQVGRDCSRCGRLVASPGCVFTADALKIASRIRETSVFFAIGFETTRQPT